MTTIDFKEMYVDPSWTCPPILISTLISSTVLAFLSIRWVKLLIWFHAQAAPDRIGRSLVISLIPVSFIVIGIFQLWFGEILYKEYYKMEANINSRVGIPVYPVWLVGVFSIVIYILILKNRNRTASVDRGHKSGMKA